MGTPDESDATADSTTGLAEENSTRKFQPIDVETYLDILRNHSRPKGLPPTGIQQLVRIRDGPSLSIGLRGLPLRQPGLLVGTSLAWGHDVERGCLAFATSAKALEQAVSSSTPTPDPSTGNSPGTVVRAESTVFDRDGAEVGVTIPRQAQPDYVRMEDENVPDRFADKFDVGTPDFPPAEAGRLYLLVASHEDCGASQETVFRLRSLLAVAEEITPETVTEFVTKNEKQGHVLADIATDDRIQQHLDDLHGDRPLPEATRFALTHGRSVSQATLRAALLHLRRVGALSLFAEDTSPPL